MKLLNTNLVLLAMGLVLVAGDAYADWSIDLSRRSSQMRKDELSRSPSSVRMYHEDGASKSVNYATEMAAEKKNDEGFIDRILDPGEPAQDIVILNTPRGFVPNTIRVRRDARYTVHVVNVNEKEKNVSFILDGFSENHATFYGKVKTFQLEPKKEGVFSFLSPETAAEGKFVVFATGPAMRNPAAAAKGQ